MDKKAEHDFSIQLVDELLSHVLEADEWMRICKEDPRIQAEETALEAVMKRVGALIPQDLQIELENAFAYEELAYINAAILYGMRVTDAIRDGVNRQIEVSQMTLDQMLPHDPVPPP